MSTFAFRGDPRIPGKIYKVITDPDAFLDGLDNQRLLSKHQFDLPLEFREDYESKSNVFLPFNKPFLFIKSQSGIRHDDHPDFPTVEYVQMLFEDKILVYGADVWQRDRIKIVRVT